MLYMHIVVLGTLFLPQASKRLLINALGVLGTSRLTLDKSVLFNDLYPLCFFFRSFSAIIFTVL